MNIRKIFGIGLSRTGTTSLTKALRILGFSAIHFPTSMTQIENHEAATDTAVANIYRDLDARYPGSKFIFTERSREEWLLSCERYWALNQNNRSQFVDHLHTAIYGTIEFDREAFSKAYDNHESLVREYFSTRPTDLLFVDVCASGDPWPELCPFLGVEVPMVPFPHHNSSNAVDFLLKLLLTRIPDIETVSQRIHYSPKYLAALLEESVPEAFEFGSGYEIGKILLYMCEVFGGEAEVSSLLNIDTETTARLIKESV